MKTGQNNSQLDAFISGALKGTAENFQPFDWSELDVLLKHDQKPISLDVSKKTIFIGVGAVVALLLVFGIFKIAQHYSSLPAETGISVGSPQNSFNAIDTTNHTAHDPALPKADTTKPDSTVIAASKPKTDSVVSVVADTTSKKIKETAAITDRPKQKKEKKKKADTVAADTSSVKSILPPDTVSKVVPKEIIIEAPPAADTTHKNTPEQNMGPKKKKSKSKKAATPSAGQPNTAPPVAKPDSLKQQ